MFICINISAWIEEMRIFSVNKTCQFEYCNYIGHLLFRLISNRSVVFETVTAFRHLMFAQFLFGRLTRLIICIITKSRINYCTYQYFSLVWGIIIHNNIALFWSKQSISSTIQLILSVFKCLSHRNTAILLL